MTTTGRYRNYLISVKCIQQPNTELWTVSANIESRKKSGPFRHIQLSTPSAQFKTQRQAEREMIQEAKELIDRLKQIKPRGRNEPRRATTSMK
jgi:hypothetical protein